MIYSRQKYLCIPVQFYHFFFFLVDDSHFIDEGVESGTETEGGRSPRLMLNLQRQVISPSFVKVLNEQLSGDRLENILMESDFRERIVPGKQFFLHSFSVFFQCQVQIKSVCLK